MQEIIRAEKSNLNVDDWGSGKMPRKKLPLPKAGRRAHHLGTAWRWRFAEFRALGASFVVRLIVNEAKSKASALIALKLENDSVVLATYEYHADLNTGWHLYSICGDLNGSPRGTLVHGPWVTRIPAARSPHRRKQFFNLHSAGGAEAWLWRESMRFFGIEEKGPLV